VRSSIEQLRTQADRTHEELARIEKGLDRFAIARGMARPARRARERGTDPLLAFVHIPKTAGGTVNSMFLSAYEPADVGKAGNYMKFAEETAEKLRRPRVLRAKVAIGHVPLGVFREALPEDTRYMTFLREPVDRVLSHYYRHLDHKLVATSSLEEALEKGVPDICDLSTRFLSGTTSATDPLGSEHLETAKANLADFAFVGIQERFEESVAILKRMLELGPVRYENQHVSGDRPTASTISAERRRLILERNAMDSELYEFGVKLFERAVEEAGPSLAAEAEEIRGGRIVNGPQ
jgi:hypothetical protein